jgi:hypothetical protein
MLEGLVSMPEYSTGPEECNRGELGLKPGTQEPDDPQPLGPAMSNQASMTASKFHMAQAANRCAGPNKEDQ